MESLLASTAESLGVSSAALKVVVLQLLAYPAALIFKQIPTKQTSLRHLFSVLVSSTFYCTMFDASGFAQMVFVSLIVYAIVSWNRNNKLMPFAVTVVAMTYLSYCHLAGLYLFNATDRFDNTAPVMILVIKWTSFAWSSLDATLPPKSLSTDQHLRVIKRFPSLVEYGGYLFFFGGFLAPFNNTPSPVVPALECILLAFFYLAFYVRFSPLFSFSTTTTAEFYTDYTLLQKFMFFNACGFLIRTKFYIVWKLSEGACILSGLGYKGFDSLAKTHDWSRVQNIKIFDVEFPENPRSMMGAWNINTQRNHVYLRLINPAHTNATLVTTTTFMVSALWHGFHPGYYLSFLFVSVYILTGRIARRHVRPLFTSGTGAAYKRIYDFVGYLCSWSITNYLVAPFQLLKGNDSLKSWGSMWFYQHLAMIGLIAFVDFAGGAKLLRDLGAWLGVERVEPKKRVTEAVKIE